MKRQRFAVHSRSPIFRTNSHHATTKTFRLLANKIQEYKSTTILSENNAGVGLLATKRGAKEG